jgi:outer membrane immunogenic protein
MKYQLTIAALLAGLAIPAQAQAEDLTGLRVEGRIGWDRTGADLSIPNPDFDEDDADSTEFLIASPRHSDLTYGGEIGYDYQFDGGLVVGAYAGVDFSNDGICAELVEDDLACTGLDRTFTIGARAGMALGNKSMVYVKGGYSHGKIGAFYDPDVTDNGATTPGPVFEFSDNKGGWHGGAGVEVGLMGGLYAKLEYTYTDYGNRSYVVGTGATAPSVGANFDRHQVVGGVGFRF